MNSFNRLRSLLPSWFGDDTPLIDGVIYGLANTVDFVYSLYLYAKLQTRIKTATDGWLDMISYDFFGDRLPRRANQSDTSFRARIIANIFRERATRNAIKQVLIDITGREPIIFETTRPEDTGAYSISTSGYGVAGGYGSLLLPFQCFVTAYLPLGAGIPDVAGYGISTGAYSTPSQSEYASYSDIIGQVTRDDIFEAIDSVKPAATIVWTNITN